MTGISSLSALLPSSQASNNSLLLAQIQQQLEQSSQSSGYGPSSTVDLSDAALSALSGGDGSSNDATGGMMSLLTYGNFSGNSFSSGYGNLDALLGVTGAPSTQDTAASLATAAPGTAGFSEAELADGGPLPAFLAYVDTAMNLSSTQAQSLQNIAAENMNANDTPQTVATIAGELQKAGISETI